MRTLSDHDIEEASSLANSLRDERTRITEARDAYAAAPSLSTQLSNQIRASRTTSRELAGMQDNAAGRMRELRPTAWFLTKAEAFWLKAITLLQVAAA